MNDWLSALIEQRNSLMSSNDAIDAKANTVLAACLTVIAVLFAFRIDDIKSTQFLLPVFVLTIVCLCVSFVYAIKTVGVKDIPGFANTRTEQPGYLSKENDELVLQLIWDVSASIEKVREENDRKGANYFVCQNMFILSFSLLIVCLTIQYIK